VKSIQLNEREKTIAARILQEISERLEFLSAVGLSYLSLNRFRQYDQRRRSAAHTFGDPDRIETAWRTLRAR